MSKQVIQVEGEDVLVREDTAKSFRGVHWAFFSLVGILLIMAILVVGGFIKLTADGTPAKTPADIEKDAGR